MMTAFMRQVCEMLEAELRPSLAAYIDKQYRERGAAIPPTPERASNLIDGSLRQMRLAVEQALDQQLGPAEAQKSAITAIRSWLKTELDQEFPQPLVIPA